MPETKKRLFYGWVVLAVFFITGTTLFGARFSFGVFFKSLEGEFNLSRAAVSAILSASMIVGCLCTIPAGWALDRYGPKVITLLMGLFSGLSLVLTGITNSVWQLFVTYGLLLALGTGPTYVISASTSSRWFNKKRGLALGIASSGVGLGSVVMAPLVTYLIASYDWRFAYIIIGIIVWLIVVPLSLVLKTEPADVGLLPDGLDINPAQHTNQEAVNHRIDLTLRQALKTRSFWCFIFVWLMHASTALLITTHLVPHTTDMGFSAIEAAAVFSTYGIAIVAGRLVLGSAGDRLGRKKTAVTCALALGIAMAWLSFSTQLWMLYVFALVYGFMYGGIAPSMAAMVGDAFGLSRIGVILGLLEVGFGIGAAIGPAIGGYIFDINGTYTLAFELGVAAMFLAALSLGLTRRETRTRHA